MTIERESTLAYPLIPLVPGIYVQTLTEAMQNFSLFANYAFETMKAENPLLYSSITESLRSAPRQISSDRWVALYYEINSRSAAILGKSLTIDGHALENIRSDETMLATPINCDAQTMASAISLAAVANARRSRFIDYERNNGNDRGLFWQYYQEQSQSYFFRTNPLIYFQTTEPFMMTVEAFHRQAAMRHEP